MSNNSDNPNYRNQDKDDQSIDLKSLVYIFLNHWYLFLICVVIALGLGYLYNRFKAPEYQVAGTLLIKDQNSALDPTAFISRSNYYSSQNLENEISILKSYTLCEQVVKKMDLEVSYYDNSGIISNELYKSSPIKVTFDRSIPQAVNLDYDIVINGNKIALKATSDFHTQYDYTTEQFIVRQPEEIEISGEYTFDEWIDTGYNRFMISTNSNYKPHIHDGRKLSFRFSDYLTLTNRMRNFSVSSLSKQGSIISISMTGQTRQKMVEFINTLMNTYVTRGLDRKNEVSENTIRFIDQQLQETESSLNQAEVELQDFRSSHDLTNLNAQSTQVISSLQPLEEERHDVGQPAIL